MQSYRGKEKAHPHWDKELSRQFRTSFASNMQMSTTVNLVHTKIKLQLPTDQPIMLLAVDGTMSE